MYDTDRNVSQPQEPGEDDPSNSNLSQESEQDEAAIDLNACSKIAYHQDGNTHGVKYVKEGKGGYLLLGKGGSLRSLRTCSDRKHLIFEQLYNPVALKVILIWALTAP